MANKGVVGIPVAKLADGTEIQMSAQKVEQIPGLLWGILLAICGFALIELYKMVWGTGKLNSADVQVLKQNYAAAVEREKATKESIDAINEVLEKIQNKMITEDRVREIAEDRIEYAQRLRARNG